MILVQITPFEFFWVLFLNFFVCQTLADALKRLKTLSESMQVSTHQYAGFLCA
jgi:hypothetical protein